MITFILLPKNGWLKSASKFGKVTLKNETNKNVILEVSDDGSEIKIINAN